MRLSDPIPALPVAAIDAALDHYTARFGFSVPHHDAGFAIINRDDVYLHLWAASDTAWRLRDPEDLKEQPVRTGAEDFIAGTASCRILVDEVDALYTELAAADVLHPRDRGEPEDTDFGTREFATLDLDGNLLTFYTWR